MCRPRVYRADQNLSCGSAPSPPILAQIWIFLAQNLGNYVVVQPLLNWADIWTVEPSKPILVKLVGNRDDRRESGRDPPSRFGP